MSELPPSHPTKQSFLHDFRDAFAQGTLVKLTLGRPNLRTGVQKLIFTPVDAKGQRQIKAVERYSNRDVTHILDREQAIRHIDAVLGVSLRNGTLFSRHTDVIISFNRRGEPHLTRAKATFTDGPVMEHNRSKNYLMAPDRPFLLGLGIADRDGRIKPAMAGKYKQIQKFVELIDSLIRDSALNDRTSLSIVDIGSGKGYLTFALYDYLQSKPVPELSVVGIERRPDLVAFCKEQAKQCGMPGLSFEAEQAGRAELENIDIVIALHACDTATDDAIAQGILQASHLIVCAPCCQHELAPQLKPHASPIQGLLRFGLFKQRQADLVTDAARALLLEAMGYRVKVIEFVSTEHTNKNVMLAATRSLTVDRQTAFTQYLELQRMYGFSDFTLANLLSEQIRDAFEKP